MSDNRKVAIEKIAREALSVETLEARNSDRLDFSEQAVWTLRRALEAAYDAGQCAPRDTEYVWINIGIRATKNSDGSGWDMLCGEDKARDVDGIRASQIMYAYCDECLDALQTIVDQSEPIEPDEPDYELESDRYSGTPDHRWPAA